MSRSERGSAIILFVTFLIPLALLLFMAGIDVAQFYGLREDVRQILDSEARASLARVNSPAVIETRVRHRVKNTHPLVSLEKVSIVGDARARRIEVSGRYQSLLSPLLSRMLRAGDEIVTGIPFLLSSRARKATSVVLVVIDRTISGGDLCTDEELQRRAMFAGELVGELHALGVSGVAIGVIPGAESSVDILSVAGGETDESILRCPGESNSLSKRLSRISGVSDSTASDARSIGATILGKLFEQCQDGQCPIGPIEQRSLVMIGPATIDRTEIVATTLDMLSVTAERSSERVRGVGVAVRPQSLKDEKGERFPANEARSRKSVRLIDVSDDDIRSGPLKGAVAQFLQGRTFISQ